MQASWKKISRRKKKLVSKEIEFGACQRKKEIYRIPRTR